MILAALFIISAVLVTVTGVLAITVSPLYFPALLLSLVIPAFLTIRSYKSPNEQEAAESPQPVAGLTDY
jgi:hypothetical protein